MRRGIAVGGAVAMLVLTACAGPGRQPTPPTVVATTTQLGSVVGEIAACAGGTSETLMTPGLDPHEFSLSSAEVARMERAKLVVANGLGLEGAMSTALAGVVRDGGTVYEVGPTIDPLELGESEAEHEASGHEHAHGTEDPHFWMDVARMARAAVGIGAELARVTGDQAYADCGTRVGVRLQGVDAEVRRILAAVPAERRVLITDHEAFGYFARAYDFKVAAVVVPGGSADAAPSSADLAGVVAAIETTGVRAIFSNTAVSPKLVQAVSEDARVPVTVVPLYVDSVGPAGSGATTYSEMMLADAHAIADALAS